MKEANQQVLYMPKTGIRNTYIKCPDTGPEQIRTVYLSGGSSRIPFFAQDSTRKRKLKTSQKTGTRKKRIPAKNHILASVTFTSALFANESPEQPA